MKLNRSIVGRWIFPWLMSIMIQLMFVLWVLVNEIGQQYHSLLIISLVWGAVASAGLRNWIREDAELSMLHYENKPQKGNE